MPSIVNGKWVKVFLLIFLNNLLLGAFVPRTIYGMIFILPYLLTVWEGLGQGVLFSKTYHRKSPLNPAIFFEFGGYLFAILAGMNLGLSLLLPSQAGRTEAFMMAWKDVVCIYPIVVIFLVLGATSETLLLKNSNSQRGSNLMLIKPSKRDLKFLRIRNKRDQISSNCVCFIALTGVFRFGARPDLADIDLRCARKVIY